MNPEDSRFSADEVRAPVEGAGFAHPVFTRSLERPEFTPSIFEPGLHGDRVALFVALIKAQSSFTVADKSATNPHFGKSYAPLSEIIAATDPALHANGLAMLQPLDDSTGEPIVYTVLMHESGAYWCTRLKVAPEVGDVQKFGGRVTYLKRYARMAMLGVATDDADDDDGESDSGRGNGRGNTQAPRTQPTPPSPRQPQAQPQQRREPPREPPREQAAKPPAPMPQAAPAAAPEPWDPEPQLPDATPVRNGNARRPIIETMRLGIAAGLMKGSVPRADGADDGVAGVRFAKSVLGLPDDGQPLSTMTVGDARKVCRKLVELGVEVPHVDR